MVKWANSDRNVGSVYACVSLCISIHSHVHTYNRNGGKHIQNRGKKKKKNERRAAREKIESGR